MNSLNKTKILKVGNLFLGGGYPVLVQSMLSCPSEDIKGNIEQAIALEKAGCDIVRVALPTAKSAVLIKELKSAVDMPIVADVHFDYKIALAAVESGVDKIRINPGNIGTAERVRAVVEACKDKKIPIRIGVNGGSLEKHLLKKYKTPTAEAMVESAKHHISLLEAEDFTDIVLSLKSSNLHTMLSAYRLAAKEFSYPLHLGVTEAGTERMGIIKSAIGIGALLTEGIGDTIRVSLTADPTKEIAPARDIIKASGRDKSGINIISCPTCGRTKISLIELANQVEKAVEGMDKNLTIAVMGCVVNGPGEAKEADIGIAGGNGEGLIFKKGEIVEKVAEDKLLERLIQMINEF